MKSLYSSFTTFHALQTAWKAVRAKNATGGIDGHSIVAFEKQLDDNLHALQSQLASGTWNPEPYLNIEIPKNETEKIHTRGKDSHHAVIYKAQESRRNKSA